MKTIIIPDLLYRTFDSDGKQEVTGHHTPFNVEKGHGLSTPPHGSISVRFQQKPDVWFNVITNEEALVFVGNKCFTWKDYNALLRGEKK